MIELFNIPIEGIITIKYLNITKKNGIKTPDGIESIKIQTHWPK